MSLRAGQRPSPRERSVPGQFRRTEIDGALSDLVVTKLPSAATSYDGGRGTFNASGFYMDIRNLQATLTAGTCSSRIIFNVPDARSAGVELELAVQPTTLFDFAVSASVANARLQSTITSTHADGAVGVSGIEAGRRLPTTPRFQAAAAATWRWLAGGWVGYLSGTFQHVGSRYTQVGDQAAGFGSVDLTALAGPPQPAARARRPGNGRPRISSPATAGSSGGSGPPPGRGPFPAAHLDATQAALWRVDGSSPALHHPHRQRRDRACGAVAGPVTCAGGGELWTRVTPTGTLVGLESEPTGTRPGSGVHSASITPTAKVRSSALQSTRAEHTVELLPEQGCGSGATRTSCGTRTVAHERLDSDIVWDGVTQVRTLTVEADRTRHALADAAKSGDWQRVFELLSEHRDWINSTRPGGSAWYAPLHQAAWHGAPVTVVQQLLDSGAWRTHQNARGERPLDIADRQGHRHLFAALTPEYRHRIPLGVLLKVQAHFHTVIRGRAERLIEEHGLRLPELEPLLELDRPKMWFAVPSMYGGFSYRLEVDGVHPKLVSESWCRVVGGSGQRHAITPGGSQLVEEGFV